MVKRCVAAGCSNTYNDGVRLYKFPRDPELRRKWMKQVERTRAHWNGPSEHSVLCSEHFYESCFEPYSGIAETVGIKQRRFLKPDAVPTIFTRPASSASSDSTRTRKRSSSQAVSTDCKSKKRRSAAYEKRERSRVSFVC